MKKFILGTLAGAIIAQVWGVFSWMVLPWHNLDFRQFANESAVADVIRAEAKESGLYTLPNMDPSTHSDEAAMKAWNDRAQRGPFAFISLKAEGIEPGMGKAMGLGFVLNATMAAILFWMLTQTSIQSFLGQAFFLGVAGFVGAMYPHLSNWNWWHFPASYCIVGVVDLFVTWFLAGLAMAKIYR